MRYQLLRRVLVTGTVALGLGALPAAAQAQAQPDEAALLRRRVVQLEDRVVTLERQLARLEQLLRELQPDPVAGVAVADASTLPVPFREHGWRFQEAWRRLRRGDTQLEVRQLLGKPFQIAAGEFVTTWYYPGGGAVRFSALGERVEAWREP